MGVFASSFYIWGGIFLQKSPENSYKKGWLIMQTFYGVEKERVDEGNRKGRKGKRRPPPTS